MAYGRIFAGSLGLYAVVMAFGPTADPAASWRDPAAVPASVAAAQPAAPADRSAVVQIIESAAPETNPSAYYVAARSLRMRSEPSLSAPVVGAYRYGSEVIVEQSEGPWVRVVAPDGRTGWMSGEFLIGDNPLASVETSESDPA